VKTRTLLLLALACGLAIMLAGAVFLFQLAGQDEVAEPVPIGEPIEVGDMQVTVMSADERVGSLEVAVTIGGVDDPDGASGFHLVASGRVVGADPSGDASSGVSPCGATSVDERPCTVRFDTSAADGTSRVLVYERGEERVRWVLS
jgi:hypothetical protein